MPPLSLPDPKRLPDLVTLSQYEAVALFIQRAQAVKPDFAVTNANAPVVAGICARLDGLPLAIELAAARAKFFAPQALLTRLEQGLALLTGGARDLPARQQTLREAIAWSYDLLSPEEKALFRCLSVFVDGCTVEAAEVVCQAAGELEVDVLDGLLSLVDKSLLRQEESTEGEPRFWMLQLLREFGLERLAASGEMETVRGVHARFFLSLAQQAEPELHGPEQTAWLERLELEHANLRASLEWALEEVADDEQARERREMALRLSTALEAFWTIRGHYSEGRTFLEQALARSEEASAALRARVLRATACLAVCQSDHDRAEMLAQQSLALYGELGDRGGIADSLNELKNIADQKSKFTQVRSLAEEILKLRRQVGEPWKVAKALFDVGDQASMDSEYTRGQALFKEALPLFRKAGDERMVAHTLVQSALWLWWGASGKAATIHQQLEQGQAIITKVGDRFMSARYSWLAGLVALSEGETTRASELAQESLAICRETGDRYELAWVLMVLGRVEAQRGDLPAARRLYQESLVLSREIDHQLSIATTLEGLAGLAIAQGEFNWAAQLWGAAEALREAMASPLQPVDRPGYEQTVAAARAQLGEEAFAAAWQEGRTMKLEQVIDDVLKRGDEAGKQ